MKTYTIIGIIILFIPEIVKAQVSYYNSTLSGDYPSAVGLANKAQNDHTLAAGRTSEANGLESIALGRYCRAVGNHSFASGINTYASGSYSTSMGDYTRAYADQSTALGQRTIANSQACLAIGKWNLGLSGTLFELGNGSSSQRNNAVTVLNNGNVGIGESSPLLGQLQIKPTVVDQDHGITINAGGTTARSYVKSDGSSDYNWFMTRGGVDGKGILINKDGNVGIGVTSIPSGYKFVVDGKIRAREVKVDLESWSDNVFSNKYELMALKDLEHYINKMNHLPDVPSEKEVLSDGISIGEINVILLKKIEELTLYIIAQDKKINELEQQIIESGCITTSLFLPKESDHSITRLQENSINSPD